MTETLKYFIFYRTISANYSFDEIIFFLECFFNLKIYLLLTTVGLTYIQNLLRLFIANENALNKETYGSLLMVEPNKKYFKFH